jgi:hypothetical protein
MGFFHRFKNEKVVSDAFTVNLIPSIPIGIKMSGKTWFGTLLLTSMLTWSQAWAEQPLCVYKADDMGNLASVSQSVCEQTQKSPECQALFKTMSPEDLLHKSLECTNQEDRSTSYEMYKEYRDGCNQGGWNFVNNMATSIGEGFAQTVLDIRNVGEEEKACNADIENKRAIFADYNISVPEILRLNEPSEVDLKELPCNRLRAKFQESLEIKNSEVMTQVQRKSEKNLTAQEQEFVEFRNARRATANGDLIESAKKKLDEMKVKYQCYNTRTAAEMICEAAAQVGTLLGGPARLAFQAAKSQRILKIAGLSRGAAAMAKSGVARGIKLENMAGLTNAQIILRAEKALDQTFTDPLKGAAVIKAHEVAEGTGRGFTVNAAGELESSTYSALDLRQKAKALRKGGFTEPEQDLLMRRGIAGSYADSAKLQTRANDLRLAAERSELGEDPRIWANSDLANKPQFPKTPVNTKAYQETAKAYDDYLKVTKNATDRDYWIAAKMNSRAENYEKSAEYFVRSKGQASSLARTEDVIGSLTRERDELRVLASKNPSNQSLQKTYKDHLKLMEAVTKLPNFPLSPAAMSQMLKP